jgi:hypothetical protein
MENPETVVKGYWRKTSMTSTYPLAFQLVGNRLVAIEPEKVFGDKKHKIVWYRGADVVLHLELSGSGYKDVIVTRCTLARELCEYIRDTALQLWLAGGSADSIEKALMLLPL